ncbi:MAG: FAD-dependent oxidoreductase, partial [Solirubrobacteraceae bacterium]
GAGFIGCEVAAAARRCGVAVTFIEREDQPLGSVLGASVGQVLADVHRDAGVRLRTGERVLSITERSDGLQVTTDRARLECAKLLVAIGIEPNTALLAGSGVDCADGVRVDEFCATNVARVFAAGDVASHYHPTFGAHVRVEHYDNAIKQGAAAAASMLGTPTPYVNPHWFWSDQYEHNLQSVGIAAGHDQVVIRGDLDGLSFSVFYLRYGVVRSVFAFNRAADVSLGRRMVLGAMRPDPDLLRDPDQDLRLAMLPTA